MLDSAVSPSQAATLRLCPCTSATRTEPCSGSQVFSNKNCLGRARRLALGILAVVPLPHMTLGNARFYKEDDGSLHDVVSTRSP